MAQNSTIKSHAVPGVFLHLVNRAAFADKVTISIWGGERRQPPADIESKPTRAIGGRPDRLYARSMPLMFSDTGNEGDLRYGKLRDWDRIPLFQLVLRSVGTPLDRAQVERALTGLFAGVYRTTVSQVELTFDMTGTSIRSLEQSVFTKARTFRQFRDSLGSETNYIGAPTSGQQLRIYRKTSEIVRIEFVLRSQYLREEKIVTHKDVALLASVDLRRIARFVDLHRVQLGKALEHIPSGWQKDISLDWLNRRSLQLLVQSLRRDERIDVQPMLRDSKVQRTLDRMQSRFVW